MEVSDMRREADGDKCVQPGAENAWVVISVYQYQRWGLWKTDPNSSQ